MAEISDGWQSFVSQPGSWRPMRYEGEYRNGRHEVSRRGRSGLRTARIAAEGAYLDDRKVGAWQYYNKEGCAMSHEEWEREYQNYDWAYDDYAGFPRGENWPEPSS
jgi:hypothetical protein